MTANSKQDKELLRAEVTKQARKAAEKDLFFNGIFKNPPSPMNKLTEDERAVITSALLQYAETASARTFDELARFIFTV